MRKTAIACGVLGLILVVASFLLAFWITPTYIARLQSNANIVRNYNGTIRTLLKPTALRSGSLSGAIITGVPETLRRQVTVQQTAGNTALVRDATTATVAGRPIGGISSNYAISRTSFAATASHPSDWSITKATGQTFNWPIGAKQQTYTGWVPQTETTVPLKYVKQQPQGGINTNVYQATVPLTPVKNPQVLASLPRTLPVSVLPALHCRPARRLALRHAIVAAPNLDGRHIIRMLESHANMFSRVFVIAGLDGFSSMGIEARDVCDMFALEVRRSLLSPGCQFTKRLDRRSP